MTSDEIEAVVKHSVNNLLKEFSWQKFVAFRAQLEQTLAEFEQPDANVEQATFAPILRRALRVRDEAEWTRLLRFTMRQFVVYVGVPASRFEEN